MKLSEKLANDVIKRLKFRNGLVLAVVCDSKTKEILMVGYQNREAVKRSFTEGRMYFWSRERRKLWLKGETSGHFQYIERIRIDCDGDAILYYVKQVGGACHEGYKSCFYRELTREGIKVVEKKIFDPEKVYRS
ncbi:MAG: phosphoribosyl-AMP cyclohydrolase [Candidatus Hadarchaeales archaeon]